MTEPPPPSDYRGTSFKGGYATGQLMLATVAVFWLILAILFIAVSP